MAERLRKRHQDEIRSKIQVSQLVNVLTNHALDEKSQTEISPTRMKAIELLLKKSLPDLSSTEITGDSEQPISIKVVTGIDA
jgi:hypothetical protein